VGEDRCESSGARENYAGANDEPEPAAKHGRFRVLLVEDNAFVSDLFEYALRKFQGELGEQQDVLMARTGLEALRTLERTRPHLVIVDHYLPGITGCALLRRMRAMESFEHTPVVVISMGGEEIRKEAIEAGATLFMDKPVQLTQMLSALRSIIVKEEETCH
jgi:CheY-like chemotaxis protein